MSNEKKQREEELLQGKGEQPDHSCEEYFVSTTLSQIELSQVIGKVLLGQNQRNETKSEVEEHISLGFKYHYENRRFSQDGTSFFSLLILRSGERNGTGELDDITEMDQTELLDFINFLEFGIPFISQDSILQWSEGSFRSPRTPYFHAHIFSGIEGTKLNDETSKAVAHAAYFSGAPVVLAEAGYELEVQFVRDGLFQIVRGADGYVIDCGFGNSLFWWWPHGGTRQLFYRETKAGKTILKSKSCRKFVGRDSHGQLILVDSHTAALDWKPSTIFFSSIRPFQPGSEKRSFLEEDAKGFTFIPNPSSDQKKIEKMELLFHHAFPIIFIHVGITDIPNLSLLGLFEDIRGFLTELKEITGNVSNKKLNSHEEKKEQRGWNLFLRIGKLLNERERLTIWEKEELAFMNYQNISILDIVSDQLGREQVIVGYLHCNPQSFALLLQSRGLDYEKWIRAYKAVKGDQVLYSL